MTNNGYYGIFGGQYVPDDVAKALKQLEDAYLKYKDDEKFRAELAYYLKDYSGRETPLYFAESLTDKLGGAKVYLKREDLNHLGAHKLNNVLGQILLAKRMGKTKVIAETGAGQHGVATAAAAAKFGMDCEIFMGAEDVRRQRLNVFRINLLGAKVHSVEEGNGTLKNAVDAAFGHYAQHLDDTFYVLGSAVGPYPYPAIVKDFQSVISKEARKQILEKEGRLPDAIIACVGGGSNAIGAFAEFINDPE
ncbi:tryptophan synthase, beta subunit, partial [Liquorilactobacillus mali KCTC 3596 = DSM 20444]